MKATQFSIISFRNNPVTEEKIAIGLILYDDKSFHFKFSKMKLNFCFSLNPEVHVSLMNAINAYSVTLTEISKNPQLFSEAISKLNRYENGMLHFSHPSPFGVSAESSVFEELFKTHIEGSGSSSEPKRKIA